MNYLRPLPALVLLFVACSCAKTTEELKQAGQLKSNKAQSPSFVEGMSREAQLILVSDEGDLRGMSLGDKPRKIMKAEPYEIKETTPGAISYSIPLSEKTPDSALNENDEERLENENFFDLKYKLQNGLLHRIEIDIYLNSEGRLDTLSHELIDYFNTRYEVYPEDESGRYIWRPDGERVLMMDIVRKQVTSNVWDYGIRVYLIKENQEEIP